MGAFHKKNANFVVVLQLEKIITIHSQIMNE